MINYEDVLGFEASRRGWEPLQVEMFDSWRQGVANVESGDIPTRLQGDHKDGYGRGKYQYEVSRGKGSGANLTAIKRLHSFLSRYELDVSGLPEKDQNILSSADPDFARLSENTQDILFLADKAEARETRLDDLTTGKISPADAWADWHWKGKAASRPAKLKQWERNADMPEIVSAGELAGSPDAWYEEVWDEVTDTAEDTWDTVTGWFK
jgi:hypothetical protein